MRDRDRRRQAHRGRCGPACVIHTAYARDGAGAWATNVEGARNVATAAAAAGARLIHVSTDVVFGGDAGRPYVESDLPDPVTDYGRSKAAAEAAVLGGPSGSGGRADVADLRR